MKWLMWWDFLKVLVMGMGVVVILIGFVGCVLDSFDKWMISFIYGVVSGDLFVDGVMFWISVVLVIGLVFVGVVWEVLMDEGFENFVYFGMVEVIEVYDFIVKVDVCGLVLG